MNKSHIRKQLKALRANLTEAARQEKSRTICQTLLSLDCITAATHIAFYKAMPTEVDLTLLQEALWAQHKRLYLPFLEPNDHHLHFVPYTDKTPLQRHPLGFDQPQIDDSSTRTVDMDVILIPMLGFDAHGYRLGYGGGFYDRLIERLRKAAFTPILIGCAFEEQRIAKIPTDAHDERLNLVVTESQLYS